MVDVPGFRPGLIALARSLQDEVKHSTVRLVSCTADQSREMTEKPGPMSLILARPEN